MDSSQSVIIRVSWEVKNKLAQLSSELGLPEFPPSTPDAILRSILGMKKLTRPGLELYSTGQVASILGVSRVTVDRLIKSGSMKYIKVQGPRRLYRYLVKKEDLEKYLVEKTRESRL